MSDFESLAAEALDTAKSSYRRRQAVSEIVKEYGHGDKTATLLKEIFDGSDVHFKRDVVGSLKNNFNSDLLVIIRPLINEDDDYLKRDVIELIGKEGPREDLSLIQPFCDDSSFSVKYAANQAVKNLEELPVDSPSTTQEVDLPEDSQGIVEGEVKFIESPEVLDVDEPQEIIEENEDPEEKPQDKVEEIHPQKQKLPDSLHDNSIFGDKSLEDVTREFSESLKGEFSQTAPSIFSGGSPENSQNLKTFFTEDYQSALALYRQLKSSESDLPDKENALSECSQRLTLLEADKADDLEQSQASVADQNKSLKDKEWEVKKAKQAIINLEKEHKELVNKILFMFSSEKKEQADRRKSELQKQLKKAQADLENESGQLEALSGESESIKESIVTLRKEFTQLYAVRDTALNKFYMTEKEINDLITGVLTADPDKAAERLSFMQDKAVASGTVKRISRLSNRLKVEISKRDELRDRFEKLQNEAGRNTEALGAEVTRSLTVSSSTRKEEVRINASLTFQEDESFFSFSNASGSASGSGRASASINVDEIEWHESGGLQSAVKNFSGSYVELGRLSTELEMAELKVQTAESALAHYIDYIRCHLESDFGE